MDLKLSTLDLDNVEADIDLWNMPPSETIIRRNIKNSPKKRICRSTKQKLLEVSGDVLSSFEPHEEEGSSVDDSSVLKAAERRTSLSAVGSRVSYLDKYEDCSNTFLKKTSRIHDDRETFQACHSNFLQTQIHAPPLGGRSRPVTKRRSVSFFSDLHLTISASSEKRHTPYQFNPRPMMTHESFCRDLDTPQKCPQSYRSSVCSSSVSSIEQSRLMTTQYGEEFCINQPSQESMLYPEDDSDEYDTDCEPPITSPFQQMDLRDRETNKDTDIGHITYQNACRANGLLPRKQVCKQLWEKKLDLKYAGLLTAEVKAVAVALLHNNRIEEVDLSNNSLNDQAVVYVIQALLESTYVTNLNLAGSTLEINGAAACGTLLSQNGYLLSLNLSGCSIGDTEVGYLASAIQVNHDLQTLNLSKNKIGILGATTLGRALGENATLTNVDLSWNHIRGAGAVALGNCMKKNKKLQDFDISWNGLGYEGSIAFGETLRLNKTLRRLNLENNRIKCDGAHYLSKGLAVNRTLEILQIGLNPVSTQGCEEILKAVAKPTSHIKLLSLKDIPINTKIALKASDIARCRDFTLQHGGILNTSNGAGIKRPRREDPLSLLIRYLSVMGIRVMDLFRMFDKENDLYVTREMFIQGLKRVRVPLDDRDLLMVAKGLQSNKRGEISYKKLANSVRNRVIENREEIKSRELIQMKKQQEKDRILQLDEPLPDVSYVSGLYNMYGSRYRSRTSDNSHGIDNFGRRNSAFTPLPLIRSGQRINLTGISKTEKTLQNLISQKPESSHINSHTFSDNSVSRDVAGHVYEEESSNHDQRSGSSYVREMKMQQLSNNLTRRQRFL